MEGQNLNSSNFRDAKATAAIFSATVAITIASIYHLARIGFNNPTWPVLTTLSLSFFLLFLPQACNFLFERIQLTSNQSWLTTDAAISLLGLIALALSGFVDPILNLNLLPLFSSLGFLFFIINAINFFRSGTPKRNVIFLTCTVMFSAWVASSVVGSFWQNYLLKEELVIGKGTLPDPLFHSSISNMIKTYGIPSTGIDGVSYLSYHFGSHWIFAQLSNLLSLDSIKFYQLGFPVIFVPFLFNRLLSFSLDLRQYISSSVAYSSLRTDYKYWLIFYVAYINCIPLALLKEQMIPPWNAYPVSLSSESYTVGMALSFILFSLTLSCLNSVDKISRLRPVGIIFMTSILPLLLGLIGLSKISCLFVIGATFIYLFIRLKLYKYSVFNLVIIGIMFIFIIVYLSNVANKPESATPLRLFGFLSETVQEGWKPFFFFINFFWSWLFILLKLREKGIKTLGDLRAAYINNSILDIEIIAVLCIAGIAPGTFFALAAGATFYFSDIQTWISLSFILANLENFTLAIWRKIE